MTQALAGRTVLVTRPAHQAAALVRTIQSVGGETLVFPALEIEAVPAADLSTSLAQLATADIVIFISPNAARFGMAAAQVLPAASRIFAVGPGTARVLQAQGIQDVITPDGQDSEALLALPQLQ